MPNEVNPALDAGLWKKESNAKLASQYING